MEGVADADLLEVTWLKGPAIELDTGSALLRTVGAIRFGHLGGLGGIGLLERAAAEDGGALIRLCGGQVPGLSCGGLLQVIDGFEDGGDELLPLSSQAAIGILFGRQSEDHGRVGSLGGD